MFNFLKTIFTWWNSATVGTWWFTRKRGTLVGTDDQGNKYYEENRVSKAAGIKRRWVIYNGYVEASRIPVDWHGWLHYTFDKPPVEEPFEIEDWEEPRTPNMTGTKEAYHPSGSLWEGGNRVAGTGDYDAWAPK
jgi:NADH:ubiquinone oxidoreductase subunit